MTGFPLAPNATGYWENIGGSDYTYWGAKKVLKTAFALNEHKADFVLDKLQRAHD